MYRDIWIMCQKIQRVAWKAREQSCLGMGDTWMVSFPRLNGEDSSTWVAAIVNDSSQNKCSMGFHIDAKLPNSVPSGRGENEWGFLQEKIQLSNSSASMWVAECGIHTSCRIISDNHLFLVGGFNRPEKYESIGMIIPNIWEKKFQTTNQLWKMTIYSGFTHYTWWFSTVMLVYQRVITYFPVESVRTTACMRRLCARLAESTLRSAASQCSSHHQAISSHGIAKK